MTSLPARTDKKLGLVIDLDTCVGCQACATSCKEWNTAGYSAPLTDEDPYGADPHGTWLNRVHAFEVGEGAAELNDGVGSDARDLGTCARRIGRVDRDRVRERRHAPPP